MSYDCLRFSVRVHREDDAAAGAIVADEVKVVVVEHEPFAVTPPQGLIRGVCGEPGRGEKGFSFT